MIPLLVFDHSRLTKIFNIIKSPHDVEKIEMTTIRLLRSHFEKATSYISISNQLTSVSRNNDSKPRYVTYSFGRSLFKTYIMTNTIHTIIQIIQIIILSIFLDFKIDLTSSFSIESGILPYRVICILFSHNIGEQNIDIYQCTLPLQYRIGRMFTILIIYMIVITFCNVICLLRSLFSLISTSYRQKIWLPYCNAQSIIHLDDIQAKGFIDYIDGDGHYIFIILRKQMNVTHFQQFFELFCEITFTETHL